MIILCGTGHRPEDCEEEEVVRRKIQQTLQEARPGIVISGMAAGFDLWLADEAITLGIPVWAARPWAGHTARTQDTELYAKVIGYADQVIAVTKSDEYAGPWVYHKRNEWMVDHATHILAYWSGKKTGGTYACLNYARKQSRPIRNIYG